MPHLSGHRIPTCPCSPIRVMKRPDPEILIGENSLHDPCGAWCFEGAPCRSHLPGTRSEVPTRHQAPSTRNDKYQNLRLHVEGHRSTTTFFSVKKSIASRPWACRSPKKLSFHPENGKYAIGAATPRLMPTLPARTS